MQEKIKENNMNFLKNKWIWIGLGLVVLVALMIWGVGTTMCKEAVC
tara:strand:+ start:301 stop:438 length:138 start_codon:yes stop_codon:yes gene_type:complete